MILFQKYFIIVALRSPKLGTAYFVALCTRSPTLVSFF